MILNNRLEIFENFVIDYNLTKYKKENKNNSIYSNNSNSIVIGQNRNIEESIEDYYNYLKEQSKFYNIFFKLKLRLFKKFYNDIYDKKIKESQKEILTTENIFNFFNNVKTNVEELGLDENTIEKYEKLLSNAVKTNQTALIEKINENKEIVLYEEKLIKNNIKNFISEQTLLNFYNDFKLVKDKHLKLTWIKNYIRIIPEDIIELKVKADNLLIFDNYVILHYDKDNNQTAKTKKEIKEEKERLKDPILFGVIKGSNKLYYIGDWIDEYCDLTLSKLVKKMKLKQNDISIEKNILNF